jgi:hypothetical protein
VLKKNPYNPFNIHRMKWFGDLVVSTFLIHNYIWCDVWQVIV